MVQKLRANFLLVRQSVLPDPVRPQMQPQLMMILVMESIVKDKILHTTTQLPLHRLQNRIVLPVSMRKKHHYLVIPIQLLPIVLGVLFKFHLTSERNQSHYELVRLQVPLQHVTYLSKLVCVWMQNR